MADTTAVTVELHVHVDSGIEASEHRLPDGRSFGVVKVGGNDANAEVSIFVSDAGSARRLAAAFAELGGKLPLPAASPSPASAPILFTGSDGLDSPLLRGAHS